MEGSSSRTSFGPLATPSARNSSCSQTRARNVYSIPRYGHCGVNSHPCWTRTAVTHSTRATASTPATVVVEALTSQRLQQLSVLFHVQVILWRRSLQRAPAAVSGHSNGLKSRHPFRASGPAGEGGPALALAASRKSGVLTHRLRAVGRQRRPRAGSNAAGDEGRVGHVPERFGMQARIC